MLKVYTHVNFERFIIPVILKFLYVFTAVIRNHQRPYHDVYFQLHHRACLMAVLGPIIIRMVPTS